MGANHDPARHRGQQVVQLEGHQELALGRLGCIILAWPAEALVPSREYRPSLPKLSPGKDWHTRLIGSVDDGEVVNEE